MEGRQGSNQYQTKGLPVITPDSQEAEEGNAEEDVQNFAQAQPGTKTVEIAAKAVGMNRETYRQAKAVVNSGNQEEIEAMDSGKKSINAAFKSIVNSGNLSCGRERYPGSPNGWTSAF